MMGKTLLLLLLDVDDMVLREENKRNKNDSCVGG